MRLGVAAVLSVLCLATCAPGGATAPSPAPTGRPVPAAMNALAPYFGSYRLSDGDIMVIARMGWFFDMRDGTYRTIYSTTSPDRFTIGPTFLQPLPKAADLVFSAGSLTVATAQRYFYDIWVGVYTSMGLDVLTYDKRGNGDSTGRYPGEFPTASALAIYADDADVALAFLARRPTVDPKRVGFHGGSRAGGPCHWRSCDILMRPSPCWSQRRRRLSTRPTCGRHTAMAVP